MGGEGWIGAYVSLAAVAGSLIGILITKRKDREAAWRSTKLAHYEEFFAATSGIVGASSTPATKSRFAKSVNNLHLIASNGVINAVHAFCDEIAETNQNRSRDRHDELWSKLVWEIRKDLGYRPTFRATNFSAFLWASGVQTSPQEPPKIGA